MLVYVYKSPKKADTFLYVLKKNDFSDVPQALRTTFGTPVFVMVIPLNKRPKLAQVDKQTLLDELNQKGFYLQLPPPPEDLLKAHKASQTTEPE